MTRLRGVVAGVGDDADESGSWIDASLGARAGDLSRMLPSEMALLAHGWPRKARVAGADDEDTGRAPTWSPLRDVDGEHGREEEAGGRGRRGERATSSE